MAQNSSDLAFHAVTAADIMTREVIAVRPETPVQAIAMLLFKHGISAVPVADDSGAVVGMVSEGDLLPRDETEREARRDWWLRMLAQGESLNPEFVAHVEHPDRTARQIMAAPVVTVPDTADIVEIAEILSANRIKRAPVLRDGRIVGIVSRADLIRAIAHPAKPVDAEISPEPFRFILPALQFDHPKPQPRKDAVVTPGAESAKAISAEGFRNAVHHHEEEETVHRKEAHRLALDKRHHEVSEMLAADLTEAGWQRMLHEARMAASKGEKEHMLVKFPCELCTDHGRAVNVPDPGWPSTLRGLPAQIFLRWKRELRDCGFKLGARVIDFPDGMPGHIGLFLIWGG